MNTENTFNPKWDKYCKEPKNPEAGSMDLSRMPGSVHGVLETLKGNKANVTISKNSSKELTDAISTMIDKAVEAHHDGAFSSQNH